MIKVGYSTHRALDAASLEDRIDKIEQSINRSPVIIGVSAVGSVETIGTGLTALGGITVDRAWLKALTPDAQWVVRAAGVVNPADANGVTISLAYLSDAIADTSLGSTTLTGAGAVKASLGPFDVFATGGVAAAEAIPVIRLRAQKLTSGTCTMSQWCVWLELRAPAL